MMSNTKRQTLKRNKQNTKKNAAAIAMDDTNSVRSNEDALRAFLVAYEPRHSKDLNLRDILRAATASKGSLYDSSVAIQHNAHAVALSAARIVKSQRIQDTCKAADKALLRAPFRFKPPSHDLLMTDFIFFHVFECATPAQHAFIERLMNAISDGRNVRWDQPLAPIVQRYISKLPREVHDYVQRRLWNITDRVVKQKGMYAPPQNTDQIVLLVYHAWQLYHANKNSMTRSRWQWGMRCTLHLLTIRRALLRALEDNQSKAIYQSTRDARTYMPVIMFLAKYRIVPQGTLSDAMLELIERMRHDHAQRAHGALTAKQMDEVDAILAEPLPQLRIEAA